MVKPSLAPQFAFCLAICLTSSLAFVGCGDRPTGGVAAHGTVTVDGRPLSGAVITMEPIEGTKGPNASAPVFEGKFQFTQQAGLLGGTYLARVSMIPPELRSKLPPQQAATLPPKDAVISPDYDDRSSLRCELIQGQANELTFAVRFLSSH